MTVQDLVSLLQGWMANGGANDDVCVAELAPRVVDVYPVVSITGVAGAALNGHDNCLVIEYQGVTQPQALIDTPPEPDGD